MAYAEGYNNKDTGIHKDQIDPKLHIQENSQM